MELLFDEMIQETLDRPKSAEELQKLRDFYVGINFLVAKLTIKAEMLDEEYKKQLFHKLVAHLKQINAGPSNQIENPELKALFDEYVHQLKKLRGKLRGDLEREVTEGISHSSKDNISELLDKDK